MARGGVREGAGRPKGGTSKISEAARKEALADGISPLAYLLGIMRDQELPRDVRMDAAKAAAPYSHAKLAAVTHSGDADNPIHQKHLVEVSFVGAGEDK
jgi:hypothetical protein